tara:strand:- start:1370 stop:1660 length:291 start_codon:yes stop_codon:yes gene_type:complete
MKFNETSSANACWGFQESLDLIAMLLGVKAVAVYFDLPNSLLPQKNLLSDRRDVASIRSEQVPHRHPSSATEPVAIPFIEMPLVRPCWPMKPHRVI